MLCKMSIRQSFRAPVRLLASFVVVALVCAFLVIGVNLRQTAQNNLQLLHEEFDVVAIPTFRGSVNDEARLTMDTENDYQGYMTVPAFDYDLSQIENAAGVKDVLVHKQFGAYVELEENLIPGDVSTRNNRDVFLFTYLGDQPLQIGWVRSSRDLPEPAMSLDWSARGYHRLPIKTSDRPGREDRGIGFHNGIESYQADQVWAEALEQLGLDEMWPTQETGQRSGTFVLRPGQQYIACGEWAVTTYFDGNENYIKGADELDYVNICVDEGHTKRSLSFESNQYYHGWYAMPESAPFEVAYPCIMPYTDDFWETEAGAYFRDAIDICRINGSTLTAVSTPDLSMYTPFYNGDVYISEGRSFTNDDYTNGSKVCIISSYLAAMNGWQIGDKLDLSFFEALYGFSGEASDVTSYYEPLVETYNEETGRYELHAEDILFDEGQFEIVGFFDGKVTRSNFMDDIQYDLKEGVDRQIVFVPESAVTNQPEVPLSQYNTTVLLDDEQVKYFLSDMEASGLLEQKKGQYQVTFEIFDQGYGAIKQSLRQLDTVSRLTLYLACAAAVVVIVLLAVLTVLQNRRQIATLRSLGVKKRQIPAAVLSGIVLVCLLGVIAGGVLGHALSDKTAAYILDTAQMDLADTAFSAMLAKEDAEAEDPYAISISSDPKIAGFSAAVVLLSFTLLSVVLVMPEAQKSPMLTLGAKE